MTRICEKCGRGALKGHSRSHSNIATIKRQAVNLQWKRVDGAMTRICTNCMKTMQKKRKS